MKKKFLTLLVMVLAIACAMTSCFKGQKTPEKITVDLSTVKTTYELNETPDFSGIKVTVTYNDDSTETIGKGDLTIGAVDTSTPGTKAVTVTYEGITTTFDITVKAASADGGNGEDNGNEGGNNNAPTYLIMGAELPTNLTSLTGKKAAFRDNTLPYVVGDDNPYIFTLDITVLDENNDIVVGATAYTSASKVYILNDDGSKTLLEGDAIATYVVIDETKNSFDFTEAAVDMMFVIESRPATNLGVSAEDATCTHTVAVVDGYNVYNAKELNFITNDAFFTYGPDDDIVQIDVVNAFLAANGLVRPEKLAGIVIHNDYVLTKNDLPAEYFVPASAGEFAGYIYDDMMIYNHAITADVTEFSVYGNYFTIDTRSLPKVPAKNDTYNGDGISNAALFRFSVDENITITRNEDGTAKQPGVAADAYQSYDPTDYVTNVVNLALRNNEPNSNVGDEAFLDASKRGLIGIKTRFNTVNIINTRVEAFMLSLLTDYDHQVVNLYKVDFYNAWQNHIFASSKNLLWEFNEAEDVAPNENYFNPVINIIDSRIAKCGGPVIISQTDDLDEACCAKSANIINIDDATEIYSYVNGTEPWFQAYGVTNIATQIMGLSQIISYNTQGVASFTTSVNENTAMNLVMVNMVAGSSLSLGGDDIDGRLVIGNSVAMNMNDGENPYLDAYLAGLAAYGASEAPVFQTTAGGTFASDGASQIFGLETGAPGTPTNECFAGKYITLYYLGIAITFEYYNPTNPA